ncbi:hypothetical protein AZE42_04094 [Rhizopogon vesiculosus]|uniref:Uncharacterized protein n=1 Tax=Rhizopogon vesiculosus TaxID=180088 RepID=A0A1J8QJN0_9AGAM|nr:hypothetical protein AZE42_04094 [Rhizopogon vesiculosus]
MERSASYQPSQAAELVDAVDSLIQEQSLDQKPLTKQGSQRAQDPQQKPHYQLSAELTKAINCLHQQSTASEEDQKLVLDP